MKWIAVAVKIADDPKVARVGVAVGVQTPHAVGLVVSTLCHFPEHARDGNVAAVPDVLLEKWAGWHGRAGAFAAVFRAEFCTADGVVGAWAEWNGAAISKSDRDADRLRTARKSREHRENVAETSRDESATRARASRKRHGSVTGDKDMDSTSLSTHVDDEVPRAEDPAAAYLARRDTFAGLLEPTHVDAYRGYLRSARFPEAVLAHLESTVSGLSGPGGKPVPPNVVGRALVDMRVAGVATFNAQTFAGFVRKVLEPARAPSDTAEDDEAVAAAFLEKVRRGELLEGAT